MTEVEHKRWCIKSCPITRAENTIFWFLYGEESFKFFFIKKGGIKR